MSLCCVMVLSDVYIDVVMLIVMVLSEVLLKVFILLVIVLSVVITYHDAVMWCVVYYDRAEGC
jgi:hypothetical protein